MSARRIAAVVGLLFCAGLVLAGVRGPGTSAPIHARLTDAPGITEYPFSSTLSEAEGIAQGPDGDMWVALSGSGELGVVTPGGSITYITVPLPSWNTDSYLTTSSPHSLALGPDGRMWFTDSADGGIGAVSSSGQVQEYQVPSSTSLTCSGSPWEIIAGPNGNMWFTMYEDLFDDSGSWSTGCIGEITMSGAVTLTELTRGGTVQSGADPEGIVLGPDGDVWVADPGTSAIDRITPSGAVTEYMISSTVGVPAELAVGPDSAIWFTEVDNYWVRSSTSGAEPSSYVGSISTDGHTLQQYSLGSYSAASLSPGPVDGALWFTDPNNDSVGGVTLGDYVGEYPLPTANALPEYLTGASNGSIWASESKVPGVATFSPPSDLGFAVQAPVQTFPVGANLSSVVFVHGINGNFRALQNAASSGDASNWGELLEPLAGNSNLSVFPYYQDLGYSAIGTANADCGVMPAPVTYPTSNLYLNPVGSVLGEESSSFCDSESALALDAQALDQFVQSKQANVVVANSMGGAIARGWLAYAQHKDPTDTSPEMKDLEDVVFLQGAQQGSWLAGLGEGAQGGVTAALGPVLGSLEKLAVERLSFDPLRPGVADLAPTSDWYKSVNSDPIPTNVNYYNVFTDEQIQLETCFLMWCGNTGSPVQMGDTVMLPGGDAPSAMPSTGGARFLPAAQAGYQRYEYEIGDLYTWSLAGVIKNPIGSASILIDNPASHFNFGSHANEASAFTVRSCNSSQQVTVTNLVLQVVRGEC